MKRLIAAVAAVSCLAPSQQDATVQRVIEDSKNSASILVDKSDRKVLVYQNGAVTLSFSADFGKDCPGMSDKSSAQDTCAPEGLYKVLEKRGTRRTRRYKELLLDYPNQEDMAEGMKSGTIGWRDLARDFYYKIRRGHPAYDTSLGGPFGIGGYGGTGKDWTDGYVAISNDAMDSLFPVVREGATVGIIK